MNTTLARRWNLVPAYYRPGDKDRAVAYYRKALEQSPYAAATYSHLGVYYCEMGNVADGIKMLELAVRYDPTYLDAVANLGIA